MSGRRAGADPRERHDGLGWVTRAVFADERLRVTLADGQSPPGDDRVLRFAVVPSVRRARFLLPLGSRRVTAASVLAYNALRPAGVRAARALVGALARAGAAPLGRLPVLSVVVPPDLDPAEVLLVRRLAAALPGTAPHAGTGVRPTAPHAGTGVRPTAPHAGTGVRPTALHAAIGVRPPDPNRKPTLQLFDDAGRPAGYAKIGWNGATRALVRAEAAALRALPRPGGADYPLAPELLLDADWAGQAVAVIAPLPPRVRRLDAPQRPRLDAMLAVARRGGPAARPRPLAGSPFHRRLCDDARAAAGDPAGGEAGRRAYRLVEALLARYAGTALEFGDWHGDWVPWNLGRYGRKLVAWDWEHSGAGVPVGFDLAHQYFQTAFVLRGEPVPGAVAAAGAALARHGGRFGLGPVQAAAVLDAYLLELWLRMRRLAAGGAGWHPVLHPGLLHVLAERLR
ncbi:hypothetical protein AB0J86_18900 [Micromonospora sp. NPDC049559]|uniref:hypothetical protein n=1 Tax=Micromonospora sp. NPDC049559 TaxID=3155923 RepID=UPI003448FB5C